MPVAACRNGRGRPLSLPRLSAMWWTQRAASLQFSEDTGGSLRRWLLDPGLGRGKVADRRDLPDLAAEGVDQADNPGDEDREVDSPAEEGDPAYERGDSA